jgi:hypothetical protein
MAVNALFVYLFTITLQLSSIIFIIGHVAQAFERRLIAREGWSVPVGDDLFQA